MRGWVALLGVLAACGPAASPRSLPTASPPPQSTGPLTVMASVAKDGTVEVDPAGAAGRLVLTAPWGSRATAQAGDGGLAKFFIDWEASGIDPLAPDAAQQLGKPWTVSSPAWFTTPQWTPTAKDIPRMLTAIGLATHTDITLGRGNEDPPILEVEAFGAEELQAGRTAKLTLMLNNKGHGAAYRVVVTTKSDLPLFHHLRFSFGLIAPGAEVSRSVEVPIPHPQAGAHVVVVLSFEEANHNSPDDFSQGFELKGADRPVMVLDCKLDQGVDRSDPRQLRVDAGKQVLVRCTVKNTGFAPAFGVQLTASLRGELPRPSPRKNILPLMTVAFDSFVRVPRDARTNTPLFITAEAVEQTFGETVKREFPLWVGREWVCEGKVSRAEFERKNAEFLDELRERIITQKQYDEYHAELVGCLE